MRWMYYHLVWSVMLFGWIIIYTSRFVISPLIIPIMGELNLTYAEAGFLVSAYFYAYVAMQFPAGHLGDRIGRKKVIVAGTTLWTFASILTGLAQNFVQIFAFRLMTGLGQGTYFGNDRPIISASTPKEKMGLGHGLSLTGMCVGATLAIGLGGYLAIIFGWRLTFIIIASPALILCFLVWKLIKEPKPTSTSQVKQQVSFFSAFKTRDLWLLSISGLFSTYIIYVLGTWTPAMFMDVGIIELDKASTFAALFGLSGIPGLLVAGLLVDLFARKNIDRKNLLHIIYFSLALLMVLLGWGLQAKISFWILASTVFAVGFFVWGVWAVFYTMIAEIIPKEISGTTFGITNAIVFIGSILSPWVTGWIRDLTGSFVWGCYIAGIFSLIAGIIVFWVRLSKIQRTIISL